MIVSAIVGFCIIKLEASPVVVGMATNTMMGGVTTYLLYIIFKTKGVFTDPSLVSLTKLEIPFIKFIFGIFTSSRKCASKYLFKNTNNGIYSICSYNSCFSYI